MPAVESRCCGLQRAGWPFLPQRRPACRISNRRRPVVISAATSRVVGIDLGTTNSAVAVVEDGKPRIIPCVDGNTTPSVVSFGSDSQHRVGKAAVRVAAKDPLNTFYSTKRLIGRDASHVARDAAKLAYGVGSSEAGEIALQCDNVPGGVVSPEEVASYILRHLLGAAEADLASPVQRAVISVPAYFTPAQRDATVAAGKLAGLENVRLIREPVAAALAYGLDLQEEATVLVADLGGGTFDVAILEVGGGTVEVLSTGGDANLGGDDWDNAIAQWIVEEHLKPARINYTSQQAKARLKAVAQSAKIALSDARQVLLKIPSGPSTEPLEILLTQQQLDSVSTPLFRKALRPLEDACQQAGLDLQAALEKARRRPARNERGKKIARHKRKGPLDVQLRPKHRQPISEVLLVGGATRMPAFQRFIENATGLRPRGSAINPDEAVAVGAAIQASMLEGQLDDFMVLDTWQAALMRAFARERSEVDCGQNRDDGLEEYDSDELDAMLQAAGNDQV